VEQICSGFVVATRVPTERNIRVPLGSGFETAAADDSDLSIDIEHHRRRWVDGRQN